MNSVCCFDVVVTFTSLKTLFGGFINLHNCYRDVSIDMSFDSQASSSILLLHHYFALSTDFSCFLDHNVPESCLLSSDVTAFSSVG